MTFKKKKIYGLSKTISCPFCGQRALTENSQGVPVCIGHKNGVLDDLKCVCGEWLDVRKGKFGPYFFCINCGNINWNRGLEMNPSVKVHNKKENKENKKVREITITSDEVDFL